MLHDRRRGPGRGERGGQGLHEALNVRQLLRAGATATRRFAVAIIHDCLLVPLLRLRDHGSGAPSARCAPSEEVRYGPGMGLATHPATFPPPLFRTRLPAARDRAW